MPVKKLKAFLDKNKVKYVAIDHSIAYTAQEVAESAHISAKTIAKVVVVKLDGKSAMIVVPANTKVDLNTLKSQTGASNVELANESEFQSQFPGCDIGAMPPFGNLYDMDVYVSEELTQLDNIVFNAGTHAELIQLSYKDFEKLVKPNKITSH